MPTQLCQWTPLTTHNTTFSPQGQQSIPEIPSRSVELLGDALFTPSGLALQDPATYIEGY